MKKILKNFLFPPYLVELLDKTTKVSGMTMTQIVVQGTIKECKKILKELK